MVYSRVFERRAPDRLHPAALWHESDTCLDRVGEGRARAFN